jgi:TolB protein
MRSRRFGPGAISVVICLTMCAWIPSTSAGETPTHPSTKAAPLASMGVVAPASAIPWRSVGPGWFVAIWVPHAAAQGFPPPKNWDKQPSTLYLVDPLGGRYRIATLPAPSYYGLLDWSGDGRRVLISTPGTAAQHSLIENVDLATGGVLDHFASPGSAESAYQYTRPKGLTILRFTPAIGEHGVASIVRLSLSGTVLFRYPANFPGTGPLSGFNPPALLPSLDGTQLVVEAENGMTLMDNDGTFVRNVGPVGETCAPVRWWDTTDFVASCYAFAHGVTTEPALWLVPINGKAATRLTSPVRPDLGDIDGWKIGTSVYLQAEGACGSQFLARRLADGRTARVNVPKTGNDVEVVGAHKDRLALLGILGCGAGRSLFSFNPTSAGEIPLLGPPMNTGSVLEALPYPGLEP